ncbi:hypothetical protein MWU75_15415 [Ornithinimicrobium sp. F0845]|uniref:hypothetical protein n=1 Tax=Ornithinimicrobium sp. F0845 TaxID=2926412 RepID=UPI001FF5C601|nr:hypothetical protein [Ornithinimicrobium sp. F0845]MCK0113536.1 hypothetical protein [Ornithinimicrobium sp. F0845]
MAVITLASAAGSPGVTTTAVGWALSRARRTILLDADPTGGSAVLAGYLQGQMVPPDALLELWSAQQHGSLRAVLPTLTMALSDSQVGLLPGTRSHTQARALGGLWEPLLGALKALEGTGQDAIIDLGRLGLEGSATPLLYGSDLSLVVCRSDLVALSTVRSWLATLHSELETVGGAGLGVVLVGAGRPYTRGEVGKVLAEACGGRDPILASLDWNPRTAAVFSAGAQTRRLASSRLVRSLRTLDDAARKAIADISHDIADNSHDLEQVQT